MLVDCHCGRSVYHRNDAKMTVTAKATATGGMKRKRETCGRLLTAVEKADDEAVNSNFYVEENRLSFQPLGENAG